jgi:hypothetical protein
MEIAVEALADIAYSHTMSDELMKKTAYDAINELDMIGAMYTYEYED